MQALFQLLLGGRIWRKKMDEKYLICYDIFRLLYLLDWMKKIFRKNPVISYLTSESFDQNQDPKPKKRRRK